MILLSLFFVSSYGVHFDVENKDQMGKQQSKEKLEDYGKGSIKKHDYMYDYPISQVLGFSEDDGHKATRPIIFFVILIIIDICFLLWFYLVIRKCINCPQKESTSDAQMTINLKI